MLNREEYNETFDCNLSQEAFDKIMGNPCKIQDAEELIFVDPETHEKTVFKRVEKQKEMLRCPFCGGRLSEDRGGYRHCYACHFEYEVEDN